MTRRHASRRFGARATRLAIFWTVLRGRSAFALLFLCACSHQAPPDAGGDASLEAGVDAGLDAGHDAGWDAGHDAAVRDAAVRDAGPEGGWSRIPDLPDGCVVEYTRDPTMLEPFRREPCPGRPGCERLIPTWEVGGFNPVPGAVAPPSFVFTRGRGLLEVWAAQEDGSARVGARAEILPCFPRWLALSDERFGLVVQMGDEIEVTLDWIVSGALAGGPVTNHGRVLDLTRVGRILADGSRMVVEAAGRRRLIEIPWTGDPRILAEAGSRERLELGALAGDTVFYEVSSDDQYHLGAATDTETGAVLVDPLDADATTPLTDGRDLAWIQAYGRVTSVEYTRLELWASPYATRAADVIPRRIAALASNDPHPSATIGGGHVALVEVEPSDGTRRLRVFRLSDGARAEVARDPDPEVSGPGEAAYVTAEHVAYRQDSGRSPSWLERVRLDSLDFAQP